MLTKLNQNVSIIDTQALGQPNVVAAYLVTGKETALIDMGHHSSAEIVIKDLTESGIDLSTLDYLLPTHVHLDHSGSCGALTKKFTNASVLVHPRGEPHLADPSRLWTVAEELFGKELTQRYGRPEPVDGKRLRIVRDDEVIDLGGAVALRAIWTPGHASHHLSYEWEGHSAFFTGDAVGTYHPDFPVLVPTTPPTSFNLEQTLQSLQRLQASSPSEFFTPHYGVIRDAMRSITENSESLLRWKDRIESMKRMGLSDEQICQDLIRETSARIGRRAIDVPDYVRTLVTLSVLGFVQYLDRPTSKAKLVS